MSAAIFNIDRVSMLSPWFAEIAEQHADTIERLRAISTNDDHFTGLLTAYRAKIEVMERALMAAHDEMAAIRSVYAAACDDARAEAAVNELLTP